MKIIPRKRFIDVVRGVNSNTFFNYMVKNFLNKKYLNVESELTEKYNFQKEEKM